MIKTVLSVEITTDPTTKVSETATIVISSKQFAGIERSDLISRYRNSVSDGVRLLLCLYIHLF